MDEYAAVVRKFYEVYRPIGRRYNLRVHSRFSMNRPGFIKIYQGDGPDRKQIIKVEEDDDVACYKRAIDELESWARSREDENARYRTARDEAIALFRAEDASATIVQTTWKR